MDFDQSEAMADRDKRDKRTDIAIRLIFAAVVSRLSTALAAEIIIIRSASKSDLTSVKHINCLPSKLRLIYEDYLRL